MLPLLLPLVAPAPARADGQLSARVALGAGKRFADIEDEVVFDTALRSELLFGAPRHRTFRIGPALELRTADFATIEGAGGGSLLVPTGDFALLLTGMVGYAARKQAPDGAVGIANLSWGYRGYNYHSFYGWGLHLYAGARRSLSGDDVLEITGGVEIDVMFTTIIPILAIKNLFSSDDPHEN